MDEKPYLLQPAFNMRGFLPASPEERVRAREMIQNIHIGPHWVDRALSWYGSKNMDLVERLERMPRWEGLVYGSKAAMATAAIISGLYAAGAITNISTNRDFQNHAIVTAASVLGYRSLRTLHRNIDQILKEE